MNETEILNNARIKLASILNDNSVSFEKSAGAFADAMRKTNIINTFKDTGSVLKDTILKEPLGVIGPIMGGMASIPLSIALTGRFDKKTETPDEHRNKLLRNMLLGFGTGASLGFGGATIKPFLNRLGKYNNLSKHKEQFINAILNKTDAFKNPMSVEQANRISDWVADKGKQTVDKMTEHLMNTEGANAVLRYMRNLGNAAVELRTDKMFWDM